uniref:Uncharacterized protein n=1 Tax=Romanomermis culicivorax TaxID=13658 RepID=A0A915IF45_ROMCU
MAPRKKRRRMAPRDTERQSQLNAFDKGIRQGPYTLNATAPTAAIWATYPKSDDVKTWQCFVDQVFATSVLVLAVMALIDKSNMEVPKGTMPLLIGFLVMALGTTFESNCGQLNAFDKGIRQGPYTLNATAPTTAIWATYPKSNDVKTWQCFVDQ